MTHRPTTVQHIIQSAHCGMLREVASLGAIVLFLAGGFALLGGA